ncbi:hypothetical protein EIP91_008016 [Steccherinum ochraceum]|uniref:Uncharacterized protein n=1 Tax=Steccherinum ochraceum TaxID=92696 RepID=A0A4V2MVB0_9APHY|nr:hypothetical protein EIP91_008016 [Steccherinum ochraceum]
MPIAAVSIVPRTGLSLWTAPAFKFSNGEDSPKNMDQGSITMTSSTVWLPTPRSGSQDFPPVILSVDSHDACVEYIQFFIIKRARFRKVSPSTVGVYKGKRELLPAVSLRVLAQDEPAGVDISGKRDLDSLNSERVIRELTFNGRSSGTPVTSETR